MRTLPTVVAYRLLGGAGTTLLACAGLAAGALPVGAHAAWWSALRQLAGPGLLCGYAGLTLLTAAWWWAGRYPRAISRRCAALTLACWAPRRTDRCSSRWRRRGPGRPGANRSGGRR
ncbi:hypothetical protein FHG89_25615, partial [Micromonospora orduensis]